MLLDKLEAADHLTGGGIFAMEHVLAEVPGLQCELGKTDGIVYQRGPSAADGPNALGRSDNFIGNLWEGQAPINARSAVLGSRGASAAG